MRVEYPRAICHVLVRGDRWEDVLVADVVRGVRWFDATVFRVGTPWTW
jgi:hypothetical protein